MTFALTTAPMTNANVKPNPNPNPNPDPYTTLNQKPNDDPRSYSFSPEISDIIAGAMVAVANVGSPMHATCMCI